MKKNFLVIILFFGITSTAQTSIKTMFYNLLYYPSGLPADREIPLKAILDTYQPDIFTVCELETAEAADEILEESLQTSHPNFARAAFVTNQSDPSADNQLHQLLFYNTDKFTLENQQTHLTYIRDINQYTLLLNTADQATNPIRIEYFVAHFKSSNGTANKAIRLDMANTFTAVLANIDPNAYVVFSGDFNFYTSSEGAYQEILDTTNSIVMVDPINTNSSLNSWHNNDTYTTIHTQATRVHQLNGNGAYSGLDDRFDFSFVSENLTTSNELYVVDGSYHAYGNNGNCYNLDISDTSCTGIYTQELRNDLYLMSDHVPVVMELEYNGDLLSVSENEVTSSFNIYGSNIVKNSLNFSYKGNLNRQKASIYNSYSQKVYTFIVEPFNTYFSIDISKLSAGIYYIKTDATLQTKPLKFIRTD